MAGVLVFTFGVFLLVGTTVALAVLEARAWSESLVTYRLRFPNGLKTEHLAAWLAGVAPGRRGTFGVVAQFGLEVVASVTGIEHRLVVPRSKAWPSTRTGFPAETHR